MKTNCSECGKEIDTDIIKGMCKSCYKSKWYKENSEKVKIKSKKWQKENPEKVINTRKKRYKKNPEKYKKWKKENPKKANAISKKWYKKNSEKTKIRSKKWKKENIEKSKFINKKWNKKNPEKIKAINKRWNKKNPESIRLRKRLYIALKNYTEDGKIMSSEKYGLNIKDIIKHLGHCPGDRKLYHIDYIRPLSSFNFINKDGTQNIEQIKLANRPDNHQWLLAKDNLSKNGKWEINEQIDYFIKLNKELDKTKC